MGLKRISVMTETVYPADDPRSLDDLKTATVIGFGLGVAQESGQLVRGTVIGASTDPDPEPTEPEQPIDPPPGQDI